MRSDFCLKKVGGYFTTILFLKTHTYHKINQETKTKVQKRGKKHKEDFTLSPEF